MIYRIRFRQSQQRQEEEATVEAHSPAEAVVKFRCTAGWRSSGQSSDEITSVQPEDVALDW